jgi:hypothetical protein
MNRAAIWKTSLLAAGICSAAMAGYHFWMPLQFRWAEKMRATPPAIAWGAHMINFCFSVLLVWGALMTVLAALRWTRQDAVTRGVAWGMGGFWVLNAAYQALIPMPLPEPMRAVGWFLLGFAVVVSLLYAVAIAASLPVPEARPR